MNVLVRFSNSLKSLGRINSILYRAHFLTDAQLPRSQQSLKFKRKMFENNFAAISLLADCIQENSSNIPLNKYTHLSPNIYWFHKRHPYIPFNACVNCNANNLKYTIYCLVLNSEIWTVDHDLCRTSDVGVCDPFMVNANVRCQIHSHAPSNVVMDRAHTTLAMCIVQVHNTPNVMRR